MASAPGSAVARPGADRGGDPQRAAQRGPWSVGAVPRSAPAPELRASGTPPGRPDRAAREAATMSVIWDIGPEVAWVESEGDRVAVLDLDRLDHPAIVLTDTSAALWRCVDGTSTDEEIAAQVAAAYEVNPDEIREQVLAFLGDLE